MNQNIQEEIDKLIDLYFNQPKVLYDHLFSSFHQFKIQYLFNGDSRFESAYDEKRKAG